MAFPFTLLLSISWSALLMWNSIKYSFHIKFRWKLKFSSLDRRDYQSWCEFLRKTFASHENYFFCLPVLPSKRERQQKHHHQNMMNKKINQYHIKSFSSRPFPSSYTFPPCILLACLFEANVRMLREEEEEENFILDDKTLLCFKAPTMLV